MATNWNAVLANINNASDILAILRKVLGLLDGKVDLTRIDEIIADIENMQTNVDTALSNVNSALSEFDTEAQEAIQQVIAAGLMEGFATEAELLATRPTEPKKYAKAEDTDVIWFWNKPEGSPDGNYWISTGLSDYTRAVNFTSEKIEGIKGTKPQWFAKDNNDIMLAAFEREQASFANIDIIKANIPNLPLVFVGDDDFTLVPLPEEPTEQTPSNGGPVTLIDLSAPTLNSLLVGWSDKPYQLYVSQLFNDRVLIGNQKTVKASFISKSLPYTKQSNELLDIDLSKVGPAAQVMFRNDSEYTKRTLIDLSIKAIGNGSNTVKVLGIGDSIYWNGGTNIMHDALVEHGYNPTFIGTLDKYSIVPPVSVNDYLHEGHSGWETGDFTNYIHDRTQPVAVGDEAKYLAAQSPYQLKNDFNPFIRAATGSDDPALIRNGYVFDAIFYRDRFGFTNDVDCIYIATGTNDLRDRSDSTLIPIYESEMKIMIDSLKLAFPSAAIILCAPNTSNTSGRNTLWNKYYRLQRSAMNIAKTRGGERIYFAPIHAMTSPEVGYLHSGTTDSGSGAVTGSFTDEIHPYHATRIQTWYHASAYAAAAKNGVI